MARARAKRDTSHMRWYVLKTEEWAEYQARKALLTRARKAGLSEKLGEIYVPVEKVKTRTWRGERDIPHRLMPGYVFVKLDPSASALRWVIRTTPKVRGFLGKKALAEAEVISLAERLANPAETRKRNAPQEGERARIAEGPFTNFSGLVEKVDQARGKMRVVLSLFGRVTPVEIDVSSVEKA
jgi:transcription termination/antitermination protein NusG